MSAPNARQAACLYYQIELVSVLEMKTVKVLTT